MKIDVIVLGAGIVGVCTALHLQTRGRTVALVDRGRPGEATSYGNAGLIERSSVIPYAFPRSLGLIAKYALNRAAAVRYDPAHLPAVAPFLYRYWRASSPRNLKRATEAMLPLIEASVDEHDALIEAAGAQDLIKADGWIGLWRRAWKFREAAREAETLGAFQLAYAVLDPQELSRFEPGVRTGVGAITGAIHWRDPKTVTDPAELVRRYAALFQQIGGLLLHRPCREPPPRWQRLVRRGRRDESGRQRRGRGPRPPVRRFPSPVRLHLAFRHQARPPQALSVCRRHAATLARGRGRRLRAGTDGAGPETDDRYRVRPARGAAQHNPDWSGRAACPRYPASGRAGRNPALARSARMPAGHGPHHRTRSRS